MILATTEPYTVLKERKIIPSERIFLPPERAGVPAEPKFNLQD